MANYYLVKKRIAIPVQAGVLTGFRSYSSDDKLSYQPVLFYTVIGAGIEWRMLKFLKAGVFSSYRVAHNNVIKNYRGNVNCWSWQAALSVVF